MLPANKEVMCAVDVSNCLLPSFLMSNKGQLFMFIYVYVPMNIWNLIKIL